MSLRDMTAEQCRQALCDLAPPLCAILQDSRFSALLARLTEPDLPLADLTALLLGEPEAVSGLLDVYRGEGRIQEVLVLFDRWRDAMDGRIWRGCMDCLLPTGVVDVGWAVGEDVLYFLSPPRSSPG